MCDYKIFSSKLKDVINLDEDLVDIKHYLINKLDLLILRNVKPRQFLRPHNFSPQHYFFSMILYPIRTSLSLSLSTHSLLKSSHRVSHPYLQSYFGECMPFLQNPIPSSGQRGLAL